MLQATLFDIKRFALHDGPGLRTTLFFKGCPLSCWWCHNPESISPAIENYTEKNKIGDHVFTCEKQIGKQYTVSDLMLEIEKEKLFMTQGEGGITLSGGEPLMQGDFALELLKECKKEGFHTAIDTSGFCSQSTLEKVLPYTDLFLYDVKLVEPKLHKKHTGVDNDVILKNLEYLSKKSKKLVIRIPIIPGVNNELPAFIEILDKLSAYKSKNFNEIHILPYHALGESKYEKFNLSRKHNKLVETDPKVIDQMLEQVNQYGFEVQLHSFN